MLLLVMVDYIWLTVLVISCAGRVLSVTWSPDAKMIYSGSSDGYAIFIEYLHASEKGV